MAPRLGARVKIPTVYIKKGSWSPLKQSYLCPSPPHPPPPPCLNLHDRRGSSMPNKNSSLGDSIKTHDGSTTSALMGGTNIYEDAQKDDWIISLAKFAVNRQNQNQNVHLQFVRVVGASHTTPSSLLYHITLEATESRKQKIYHTVVWLQLWKNFMDLLAWKPVHDALSVVGVKCGDLKLHEAVMFYMNQMKKGHPMI